MARFVKMLCATAALVVTMLLAMPTKAFATFEIDYSIDGGAKQFGASTAGNTLLFANVSLAADFKIDITLNKTNSPGGVSGFVSTSDSSVQNISSAEHTLTLYISADGFNSPQSPPPLTLSAASSATSQAGTTTVGYTGYGDANNTLFGGVPGVTLNAPGSNPVGKVTTASYTVSGSSGLGSGSNSVLFSPGATYSLTGVLTLDQLAGANLTGVNANTTTAPTPAPSTGVLALTGLPLLGLCFWVRRRTTRKVPVAA